MDDEVKQWMKKIGDMKKGEADLSQDEDLAIALMNLISLEEHFYFSAMKTDNQKYLEMLNSIRELRKKMMKKIVVSPKGEEWCISKHLLAASMRLMEVGTKELSKNGPDKADVFFRSSFDLFSLFFAINLNLIEHKKLNVDSKTENQSDRRDPTTNRWGMPHSVTTSQIVVAASSGASDPQFVNESKYMRKFSDLMKKIVDCCKEW